MHIFVEPVTYDEIFDKVRTMLGKRVIKFEKFKIRSNFTCR